MTTETCANCNNPIGKLETPMIWNDHVVCSACYQKLRPIRVAESPSPMHMPYATPSALDELAAARTQPGLPLPHSRPASAFKWGMGITFGIVAAVVLLCAGIPALFFSGGLALIASAPTVRPAPLATPAPPTVRPARARLNPQNREGAYTLVLYFKENAIKADQAYKGKTFQVNGIVHSIGREITGKPYITLGGDPESDLRGRVQFIFSVADEPSIAKVSKGDEITLQGSCQGAILGNVLMRDAQFVE